jgi:hypothetical protein
MNRHLDRLTVPMSDRLFPLDLSRKESLWQAGCLLEQELLERSNAITVDRPDTILIEL